MNGGYNENVQWVTLISVLGCYGYYFARVFPPSGPDVTGEQVGLFIGMLILLVVLSIVGALVVTAMDRFRKAELDERDRLIGLLAIRNASWVLAVGMTAGMGVAFAREGNFWVMHVLLASAVAAQLVASLTKIVLYRRGF